MEMDRFSSITHMATLIMWCVQSMPVPACKSLLPKKRETQSLLGPSEQENLQENLATQTTDRCNPLRRQGKFISKPKQASSLVDQKTEASAEMKITSLRPLRLNQLGSLILRTRLLNQPNKETRRLLTRDPLLENRHKLAKRNPLFRDRSFDFLQSRQSSRRSGRSGARSSRSASERRAVPGLEEFLLLLLLGRADAGGVGVAAGAVASGCGGCVGCRGDMVSFWGRNRGNICGDVNAYGRWSGRWK
jgi:hypothetical protein